MLTTKQLNAKTFVTYCSTTNTLFLHKQKVKPKNVAFATADFAIKNAAAQQVKKFFALPALYNLHKKTAT